MFLGYDYETNVLTNTIEQAVIADNAISPLSNMTIDGMLESAVKLVFSFDYPFYADSKAIDYSALKNAFEKTFCLQYFREQIGLETMGEFRLHLKRLLTVNMPYYEQLYKSLTFDYDPLKSHVSERTVEMKRNENTAQKQTSDTTTTVDNNVEMQSIHSDNPQVNFSGSDYASGMDRGKNTGTNTTDSNTGANGTTDFNATNSDIISDTGFDGSYSLEIQRYRETILNLNKRICDDCRELFYQLY